MGRAFADLHRIREQLAAIKQISAEAEEVLDAIGAGTLEVQLEIAESRPSQRK